MLFLLPNQNLLVLHLIHYPKIYLMVLNPDVYILNHVNMLMLLKFVLQFFFYPLITMIHFPIYRIKYLLCKIPFKCIVIGFFTFFINFFFIHLLLAENFYFYFSFFFFHFHFHFLPRKDSNSVPFQPSLH